MSNANITKYAIANTMKQLMEKIPFNNITVADIIEQCRISRRTFYYHFRDKYDVVNWIFTNEITEGILASTTVENWTMGSYQLCRYIKDNKLFYENAINASGQNCFIQFLHTLTELQLEKLCADYINKKIITVADYDFLVEFYYNAFIGILVLWAKNDMQESPEVIVKRWIGVTDKSLERYIEKLGVVNENA